MELKIKTQFSIDFYHIVGAKMSSRGICLLKLIFLF